MNPNRVFLLITVALALTASVLGYAQKSSISQTSANKATALHASYLESVEWLVSEADDGSSLTFMPEESLAEGAEISFFSLQNIPKPPESMTAEWTKLRNNQPSTQVKEFLPIPCFRLIRPDLKDRQTWCEGRDHQLMVVVESGSQKLPLSQQAQIVLKESSLPVSAP